MLKLFTLTYLKNLEIIDGGLKLADILKFVVQYYTILAFYERYDSVLITEVNKSRSLRRMCHR